MLRRTTSEGDFAALDTLGAMLLDLEVAAARSVGALSRLAGRGGGTTLPGKLLSTVDPGAVDRLAARLDRAARCSSPPRTARRRRRRWSPRSSAAGSPTTTPARTCSPGVASTLLASRGAELGLFEVDEAALPEVARRVRPRVVALGNLFRDQLDRYGELEHIAERWRALRGRAARDALRRQRRRPAARRARARARADRDLRDRRSRATRAPTLQHAADSTFCLRLRRARTSTPPPTSVTSATTAARNGHAARLPLDVAAREIDLHGLDGQRVHARGAAAGARGSGSRCPGSTTSTTRPRRSRSRARSAPRPRRSPSGLRALHGRVRPLRADPGRRPAAADAPDQEPGRRERGGADAARRLSPTPRGRRAQRRDRRRPRRLVDLGRRLRAAARRPRPRGRHRRPRGRARAPLRLRRPRPRPDRGRAGARGGARPRARAHAGRRGARRPADLHGDARACAGIARRARPRAPSSGSRRP